MTILLISKVYLNYIDFVSMQSRVNRLEYILTLMEQQIYFLKSNFNSFNCLNFFKKNSLIGENYKDDINYDKFNSNQLFKAVLLAPEYYLSQKRDKRILSRDEKITLEIELHKLSIKFKDILILPGTLVWAKPGKRSADNLDSTEDNNLTDIQKRYQAYSQSKIDRGIIRFKGPVDYYKSQQQNLRADKLNNYFNRLAMNQYDWNKIRSGQTFAERVRIFENKMQETSFIVNCAFAYLNGKRIIKHNKYANYCEEDNYESQIFMPGHPQIDLKNDGAPLFPFKIENGKLIKMGIEICYEHAEGFGKLFWKELPDLQIILSDYVTNNYKHFRVKNKGYILHASTNSNEDLIYQYNDNKFIKVEEIETLHKYKDIKFRIKSCLIKV